MKKIKICLVSVLLAACLAIFGSIQAFSAGIKENNRVSIIITNGLKNIGKSISVSVFKSTLAFCDNEMGYKEYDDELVFELTSDKNGVVEFQRPCETFTVSIDLESLPNDYGVTEISHFFDEIENTYTFFLEKIEKAEIIKDNEDYYACFTSVSGRQVYTDYRVNIIDCQYKDNLTTKAIELRKEVDVELNGKTFSQVFEDNIPYSSELSKEEILFEYNEISEIDYIQYISNYILCAKDNGDQRLNIDKYYWTLYNYIENKSDDSIPKEIIDALSALDEIKGQIDEVSVESKSKKFIVYYDGNNTDISMAAAEAVANEFDAIDKLFCTNNGFLRPYYDQATTEYKIYLLPDSEMNARGLTLRNGSYGSKIQLNYEVAKGVKNASGYSGYADMYKGVLAHEYMHAILYRYGIRSNSEETLWMHESFANWAGFVYEKDFAALITGALSTFLDSTEKRLTYFTTSIGYDLRHYGSCVFPIYIYQEMGGFSTIKKILEEYASSSTPTPLEAIDAGLQHYGYNISSAYAGCASYNYITSEFYSDAPSSGTYKWGEATKNPYVSIASYPRASSSSLSFEQLGCRYTEFTGTSTSTKLTVVVSFSNYANRAALRTIRKNSSNHYYISAREVNTGQITIVQNGFGGSSAKSLAIVPMNISSTPGSVSYSWSASVSSGSSSANYKVTNVGANKCLNIYGDNVTSLYNNQNVCLWSNSGTNEQKWYIPSIGSGVYIKSIINTSYGLNVYRVGSPWNCDLYPIVGNETDAQVDFIATGSGYKIKLHNYNLYLTANSSNNGANVYWSASSTSSYQIWRLDQIP